MKELESLQRIFDRIRAEMWLRLGDVDGERSALLVTGPKDPVRIRGQLKSPLTGPRYAVIRALLDAGSAGLTGNGLVRASGHTDAVNILKGLAKSDPDWEGVIMLPGKAGRRYRVQQ